MDNYILVRGARQLLTLHGRTGVRRGSAVRDLGVIEDGSVLIQNSHIFAVGPTRRLENMREAKQAAVIPANGRVVMPGFVDPSLGVMLTGMKRPARSPSVTRIVQDASVIVRSALQHGTTRAEVKIGGGSPAEDLRFVRQSKKLDPGGHAVVRTWLMKTNSVQAGAPAAVDSRDPRDTQQDPRDPRLQTFEYLRKKSPGVFVEFAVSGSGNEQAPALVRMAAESQLVCKLQLQGASSTAIFDLLSSCRFRTITGFQQMQELNWPKVAPPETIFVVTAGDSLLNVPSSSAGIRQVLDSNGAIALASGYDPVRSPVFNMQMSIAQAVLQAKMTTEEAITAATINAAHASGIGDQAGSLEYGKEADLLLLNLTDYRELPRQYGVNHVGMVIRSGQVVYNRIRWKAAPEGG